MSASILGSAIEIAGAVHGQTSTWVRPICSGEVVQNCEGLGCCRQDAEDCCCDHYGQDKRQGCHSRANVENRNCTLLFACHRESSSRGAHCCTFLPGRSTQFQ